MEIIIKSHCWMIPGSGKKNSQLNTAERNSLMSTLVLKPLLYELAVIAKTKKNNRF